MTCECGCGKLVKIGRRFINRHHFRTDEHKQKMSRYMKGNKQGLGYKHTEEAKRKIGEASIGNQHAFGMKHTDEWKQKMSEVHKGNQYGLGSKHTEEWKRQNSIRNRGKKFPGRVQSEESNKKRSKTLMGRKYPGRKQTEESNRKRSETLKGRISPMRGRQQTEEARRIISEVSRRCWADPEYRSKTVSAIMKGNKITPNRPETELLELLNTLHPKEWKFVGDGEVVFDGRSPDFMNIKDKCLLVEMFGDYWHKGQDPQDRINMFTPFGFSTLVVWEKELKDQPKLIGRINKFVEENSASAH